ncbi:uncharacterized protein [Arachis hypogaea]|uniref:uncharacterized protein n=1 Tax=Arachis hypogaea TaxID=3818 RepID=UPI003B20D7BD
MTAVVRCVGNGTTEKGSEVTAVKGKKGGRKREVLEVSPVKKHGKIKGESLIFTEHDGSETAIWLKGCVVEAVSSSSLPSKKWAKRYPIKVENNKSVVYHGSKLLYIYLETSWENEAWYINMGTTPPSIVAMRVLPMEMNDVCTFEADIEYSGGAVVEIETRLEVGEPQNDKGTECSSNAGAAPSDLEDLSNQLNLGDGVNDSQEPK